MSQKTSLKFTRSETLLITALAFFQFTHIVDFMILMPLGPLLIKDFGITNHEFSWLVSSYTFSAAITALVASTVIDRFHRKKLLILLYAGFLLGTLACGIAESFHLLLASRILTGAFGGLINSLIFAIIGDSFPYNRRGSATGIIMASFSVATVAGVPISLWMANNWGWHIPFVSIYISGIAIIFFAHYAIPFTKKVAHGHPYRDVFKEKNHYLAFGLVFFMMMAGFSIIPYISNYMVFNAGLPKEKLPFIYLAGGAFTFFTSRLIGYVTDRYGKKRTYFVTAGLSAIPIFFISRINAPDLFPILIATTGFFILVSGRFVPAMAMITSSVKPHMRGSFMTVNSAVQQFGSSIATLIGGMIITETAGNKIQGYPMVSLFAIGCTVVTFFFVWKIKVLDGKEEL